MELRSGRRLRRSPPPPPHVTPSRRRMDLISALPDEIILLVLARLSCFRTAVKTGVLSRRWRGLWIHLTDLAFRRLEPARIEALFRRRFVSPRQVSTLDIRIPWTWETQNTSSANSLLRAAVQLSPDHLLFTLRNPYILHSMAHIELPCFHGTTSIELDTHFCLKQQQPAGGEFTALETLSITGKIIDLGSLLIRCPRLRVLSVTYPDNDILHITLPPGGEFPALEKLSLSGKIVNLGSMLNRCQRMRVLSATQLDKYPLRIMLPPSGEFPELEKLSLSGNIADLGTLLTRCPRLHILNVTFCEMTLGTLEEALTTLEVAAPPGLVLSRLGIGIPWKDDGVDTTRFTSLLVTAARLSPQELVFTNNFDGRGDTQINAELPFFHHARSIEMRLHNVCFTPSPTGEFSALENLSLSGLIVDIGTLVTRCPRLHTLKVTTATGKITIHSASLQKIDVSSNFHTECNDIDIVTPLLKQLHLEVRACRDINVCISAPMVENVSWKCSYTGSALMFGSWRVHSMKVQTVESMYVDNIDETCSLRRQLPRFNSLCLHMYASNHLDPQLNFEQEIEKLPFTNFSELELNIGQDWHAYGPLVLQLLRIRWIRATTKKLMVNLPWFPKEKQSCARNSPSDNPTNQSTFYTSLEEVTIHGFNGEDHEQDFVRLIVKYSPMLKRVTLRPSPNFGRTMVLSTISRAYPSVQFYR